MGYYRRFIPKFADIATPLVYLTGKDVPFVWDTSCSAAFQELRASLIDAPILAFPTETGHYILDTDASNFGLGGVLSQIQNDQERVVAYCSRALRPSQRRYCTTKREMLAVVAMCIQFRSYLRGARFTLRTDHKSLVWLHRFKDTEGMLSRWLHSLQQFQFSIIHRPGKDHGNADGLSRAPSSPCRQCTRPDCPPATLIQCDSDQPFDSTSTGSSEDADLVPVQSGEDWIARLDDDLSRPDGTSGDSFRISSLQKEDPVCMTLHAWVVADEFPAWAEVKSMLPELRSLWHHRNNLSVDENGTLWRKRSSQSTQLQLLVPKAGREPLFLSYHASLYGGHFGRTRTLARLADRFYWSGMADDVKDWLSQCVACIKRKSPVGRHHPLGNIPTGHRWDRIAMDILDVCDPTPEGFRYILVIADYFSKWTEAFPMKARLADRFYWSGMADDVKDWLSQCVVCIKRKSPVGRHHPLGNIPTGHRWDRIAMDILDVGDPTPEGFRYILVIADYFSKWTEAFPIKNKCADTVADILVENIILRFGMPLVIHSDQGREFENGLMKSLCALLGCTKTRTAPYHPESDGMIERFNRTCLMMLSMFVNDRRDNWHELLPFIMHAYWTSVHESTGYSPFRLMMGEECSLPQDVSTAELRTQRENDVAPHPFATWVRDALEVAYDHVRSSLKKIASRRKRLYDTKAVNRKFPVGSWVLRYYPPAAQHKLGSPWVGPHQVVRQATGHTVGIQRDADKPIIFVHVDDLKLCPGPRESPLPNLCVPTLWLFVRDQTREM